MAETSETKGHEIDAHLGWLKMYLESMNERNWRDMRLYAQRQLERFEACLDAAPSPRTDP